MFTEYDSKIWSKLNIEINITLHTFMNVKILLVKVGLQYVGFSCGTEPFKPIFKKYIFENTEFSKRFKFVLNWRLMSCQLQNIH